MSEPDETRRRMQALLDRLALERDPKEAARLMREYERLSALAADAPAPPPSSDPTPRPDDGDRTSTPEN